MNPSLTARRAPPLAWLGALGALLWALLLASTAQAATVTLPDFTELVERQGRAVVNISTTTAVEPTPAGLSTISQPLMSRPFLRAMGSPCKRKAAA